MIDSALNAKLPDIRERLISKVSQNKLSFASEAEKGEVITFLKTLEISDIRGFNIARGNILAKYGVDVGSFSQVIAPEVPKLTEEGRPIIKPEPNSITFIPEGAVENDSWPALKARAIRDMLRDNEMYFYAHGRDTITAKPQQVLEVKHKIPIVFKTKKITKQEDEYQENVRYKFLDDRYDRRYDGHEIDCLAIEFWIYRAVSEGKEYYIFSQEQLESENYILSGTILDAQNLTELSTTLKFRSITSVMILKEAKSSIRVLDKLALVNFTKSLLESEGFTGQDFIDLIFTHPRDCRVYSHSPDFELLQVVQLLSGKYEGYPLHLLVMGPVGTGKTTYLECLDAKFQEEKGILEAGNSTPKALIPSFKEKPPNLGHILSCNRVALIDELMKMIDNVGSHNPGEIRNALGKLNMILEHKKRTIGSGTVGSTVVQATAKAIMATNPLFSCSSIYAHVGQIDDTTLSRLLIWVQDDEHQKSIAVKETKDFPRHLANRWGEKGGVYTQCWGELINNKYNSIILSILDSSSSFVCEVDMSRVRRIFFKSLELCREPMRSVWRARGLHHCFLLLDGIIKFRSLFVDYDEKFSPIDDDYLALSSLVSHIIKTWDTNLSVKTLDSWKKEVFEEED